MLKIGEKYYHKSNMKKKLLLTSVMGGFWNLYRLRFDVLDGNEKVIDEIAITTNKKNDFIKINGGRND